MSPKISSFILAFRIHRHYCEGNAREELSMRLLELHLRAEEG